MIKRGRPKDASVFTAKAWSICQALDEVQRWQEDGNNRVMICADSKSILQTVVNVKQSAHKHVFIIDIRRKIAAIKRSPREDMQSGCCGFRYTWELHTMKR